MCTALIDELSSPEFDEAKYITEALLSSPVLATSQMCAACYLCFGCNQGKMLEQLSAALQEIEEHIQAKVTAAFLPWLFPANRRETIMVR